MSNNLVSKDNIIDILKPIRSNIVSKINNKDISQEQKDLLSKSIVIDNSTNDGSILSNNGKYNNIKIDKINDSINKTNNIYDLFKIKEIPKKWEIKLKSPKPLAYSCSELYNGKIYCIGTYINGYSQSYVQIYDIETDIWTYGTPIPIELSYHSSVILNDNIYIIGGWTSNRSTINNIYIYNITNNTWSNIKPMNKVRYGHTSEIYEEKIYIISGFGGDNTVEIYDMKTQTISYAANIPTYRYYFSSILYEGKIFTGAGKDANVFEIYDIKSNKWSSLTSNIYNSYDNDMVLYNNKIYFIGGAYNYKGIYTYDIKNNTWEVFDTMKNQRWGSRCIIYKNKLYCIGGSTYDIDIECLTLPHYLYNINLNLDIKNKLNNILNNGLGEKILSDKGEYVDIPKGYRFMKEQEITELINEINID